MLGLWQRHSLSRTGPRTEREAACARGRGLADRGGDSEVAAVVEGCLLLLFLPREPLVLPARRLMENCLLSAIAGAGEDRFEVRQDSRRKRLRQRDLSSGPAASHEDQCTKGCRKYCLQERMCKQYCRRA